MSKGVVLIAAPVHPVLTEGLLDAGFSLRPAEKITQEGAPALLHDCVGVVTSTRLRLDRALIDAAPRLQWIGRMGSGLEIIDLECAAERGIRVFSSPEGNRNAVAEHTVGLLLALTKKIVWSREEVLKGRWPREEGRGIELDGMTVAIIGFGNTGQAFAKKLSGFDVRILAYDKYNKIQSSNSVQACDTLVTIFNTADVVSFHVPLRDDTVHYFDEGFVQSLQKPIILLNTSRGEVVKPEALESALFSGKVIGAGLDVWNIEPPSIMTETQKAYMIRIAGMPQVVLTPHIAGYSHQALYKMSAVLLQKLLLTPPAG